MQVKIDKPVPPTEPLTQEEAIKAAVNAERVRIITEMLKHSSEMVEKYRLLIKSTGGLLTASMVYAYSKGLNDSLKLITKGYKNEESVQKEG